MPEGNLSVKHIESCFQTGNYDKILSSDGVKAPRIQTFDFVRVLGMMMVFAQHVWAMVPFHMPDLGGKGVDLFFVMSGLVMTYNYYDIDLEPSVKGNAAFALRRIKKFYCLHVLTFLAFAMLQVKELSVSESPVKYKEFILNAAANLTLLQDWIPSETYFWGFNGVSWFLSALLFCYFCFPLLLKCIRKIRVGSLAISAIGLLVAMNIVETIYFAKDGWHAWYVFGNSPLWKSIVFLVGCMLGAIARTRLKDMKKAGCGKDWRIITALGVYIAGLLLCDGLWRYSEYIALTALFLIVFACGDGQFSKILSCNTIRTLSSISFEFYLIHHVVVIYYSRYSWWFLQGIEMDWAGNVFLVFVISISLTFAYKEAYRKIGAWGRRKGVHSKAD